MNWLNITVLKLNSNLIFCGSEEYKKYQLGRICVKCTVITAGKAYTSENFHYAKSGTKILILHLHQKYETPI